VISIDPAYDEWDAETDEQDLAALPAVGASGGILAQPQNVVAVGAGIETSSGGFSAAIRVSFDPPETVGGVAVSSPGDVLAEVIRDADPDTALGNKRFPWLSARRIELGMCPVNAIRVAYTGELGWELHHPIEMQNYLFDLLETAGAPHGMKLVGARAQNWLRQEKSYRAFGHELGRDGTPLEADLPRFVDQGKEFRGKAAMVGTGIRMSCVTLLIDGPDDADPWGREALYAADGTRAGRLTSGGYSVAFGQSIGMGYVTPELAVEGTQLKVRMFDRLWDAIVTRDSPYDPKNEAIRADVQTAEAPKAPKATRVEEVTTA